MKSYVWLLCAGLSFGACKGKPAADAEVSASASVEPQIKESEYDPAETRARVLLSVPPGSTVTALSKVGQWNFDSMVSESGGAQFNVVLTTPPSPGDELVLAFEVSKGGTQKTVVAKIRVPGAKALDLKLGFAPSEEAEGTSQWGCEAGPLNNGAGHEINNVGTLCDSADRTSYFRAKGEAKVRLEASSRSLSTVTIGGVKADFVDGKAEVALDPLEALASAPILPMVGYAGELALGISAEGPGGPFWGYLPLTNAGETATGWLQAVTRGPSTLRGERQRAARKGLLAAVRAKDATGGGLWGLFTNGGRVEGNYRITAQEVDLVAIDSGTSTVVGTCKYERATDDAKTDRDQILITSNVTIYDRKTGAKIASKIFDPGTHPGCKAEILSASGNFIKEVERAEIEAWAKSFISDDFVPGVDDAERPSNDAPKLDGLSQPLTQLTRLSQGYLGFQRGMAPAKVAAIVGAGEVLSDSASSRLRTYLSGGLHMAYALPDDGLESVTVVNEATWDALAAKGLKDPVLDLFNQPFDAAAKLLGKPSTAETNHYEWLLEEGKLSTYVSLDYFEGRCGSVGLTWLLRQ